MKSESETEKYFEAVGRRKTSVARVRIWPSTGNKNMVFVNKVKELYDYFPVAEYKDRIMDVFSAPELGGAKFKVSVKVSGGGMSSQADAMVMGLARALEVWNKDLRKPLKKAGLLRRDPRIKERRKFGLKKARKAPQWSKR